MVLTKFGRAARYRGPSAEGLLAVTENLADVQGHGTLCEW